MAPFIGPSRKRLIEMLRAGDGESRSITLGMNEPQATVGRENGVWRLRPLVMNHEAAGQAGQEAIARGEAWMHEHTFAFLEPGEAIAESEEVEAFIAMLEKLSWKWGATG